MQSHRPTRFDSSNSSGSFWSIAPLARKVLLVAVAACAMAFLDGARAGEWRNHQASLAALQGQLRQLEGDLSHLIEAKRQAQDAAQVKVIADEIVVKHAKLREISKEYEEERQHVRFKHPERGDEAERRYSRHKPQAIEELEGEVGLEPKLDRIKLKIQTVYGIGPSKDSAGAGAARSPAGKGLGSSKDQHLHQERIRLVK